MSEEKSRDPPWGKAFLGLAVFAVGLLPRMSTWKGTFRGPLVLLEEVDAWYHLRRIELALANNLVLPAADTYNNHPLGATVDWPPGFDLLLASAYHLLSRVGLEALTPAAVGAVGVAVLGSLAAGGLTILASRWGLWAGLAAGLALAWSPAAVAYSRVGRLDHHAIEPLWLVILCAAYAWNRREPSPTRGLALGIALAMGAAFWPGLAFYAAGMALAFIFESWLGHTHGLRQGAVVFLVATVLSSALALTSPWGRNLEVVYYALSWFQPMVFGGLTVGFGVMAWLEGQPSKPLWTWMVGGTGIAASAALVLLLARESLGMGIDFFLGTDSVAATVLESRSLVELGFGYAVRWLTPVGVALPMLWIGVTVYAVWRRVYDPILAGALALGVLAIPLTVFQMRFGPHAAVVAALLAGWAVAQLGTLKLSRLKARVLAGGVVAALALVHAWGVRPSTLPDSAVHPYLLGGFDALIWLRQTAPETSHFRQPWLHPEYSVAAEWVWGHWITQVGQKPNVANPLAQTPGNRGGIHEVARLFLSESEEEALSIVQDLDVRYVLLSSIPITISELATELGRDPARYVATNSSGGRAFQQPFFETFHSRLYLGGGAGAEGTAPVSRARLVFESRVRIEFMGLRPSVRIFEMVRGAALSGRCPSGIVEGRAELEGAGLVYTARDNPDPDGSFSLVMPYASERTEAAIPARITVRCGDRESVVKVTEEDVLEGRGVTVEPLSGRPAPS